MVVDAASRGHQDPPAVVVDGLPTLEVCLPALDPLAVDVDVSSG